MSNINTRASLQGANTIGKAPIFADREERRHNAF
jgi:hypothetical protein